MTSSPARAATTPRAAEPSRALTNAAAGGQQRDRGGGQLFIVALGELILVAGLTYGAKYFGVFAGHTTAFVISFATTALL